jgi:hypothetical protein
MNAPKYLSFIVLAFSILKEARHDGIHGCYIVIDQKDKYGRNRLYISNSQKYETRNLQKCRTR